LPQALTDLEMERKNTTAEHPPGTPVIVGVHFWLRSGVAFCAPLLTVSAGCKQKHRKQSVAHVHFARFSLISPECARRLQEQTTPPASTFRDNRNRTLKL
jgi:hypothetical protein